MPKSGGVYSGAKFSLERNVHENLLGNMIRRGSLKSIVLALLGLEININL